MASSATMWIVFFAVIAALLALDLGVLHRKSRDIGIKEATLLTLFYAGLALAFNGFVFVEMGPKAGYEFFMGWLIEKTLSLDNLFVFLLIFNHFGVQRSHQHRVLVWGIVGAILMRGIMIGLGTSLIHAFSFVTYIFGAFLVLTSIKMLLAADAEPDVANNKIVTFFRSRLRMTEEFHGTRFFVRQNGVRYCTPLFMVLLLIEISDVIFAVDSIPAIFAVTSDTYIVFTSNIFAILGLRAMYFALAAMLHRFELLKYGLSVILCFIGVKMIANHALGGEFISTELSLAVVVGIIAISVIASLMKTRHAPAAEPHVGWIPGSPTKKTPPEQD